MDAVEEAPLRKITQIAVAANERGLRLFGLRDDGTVWLITPGEDATWKYLPRIPQGNIDDA